MLMIARTARLRQGIVTAPAATIAPTVAAFDGNSLSTYSFTGVDLGAAAADRYIAICALFNNGTSIKSAASVTVAGQSCSLLVAQNGPNVGCEIWITNAPVTTGTTGQTVGMTTTGGAFARAAIIVYRLNFLQSNVAQFSNYSNAGFPYSMSLGISAGGVALGCCFTRNANFANIITWGGFTEDADLLLSSVDNYSSARTVSATSGTGTVTISNPAAAGDLSCACCVSLR